MKNYFIVFVTLLSLTLATTYDVVIANFSFTPSSLEISQGDIVLWTNNGSTHRVVSDDGISFESENLSNGETFQYQFDTAGEFPYKCGIHSSMTGNISVQLTLDNDNLYSPNNIVIHSAYPNPFNPATTISFSLDQYYGVSVDVYSINGKLIENLLSQGLTVGDHSILWEPSNKSAGIYLIKLTAGSYSLTQKVMLVK